MKFLFQQLPALAKAWKEYTTTDVSPGFDPELPLIPCNPVPNIKAHMLRAAVDICKYGAENLKAIQKLQDLVGEYKVEAIAVGNGTAGRETLSLCQQIDFGRKVEVYMVNEGGASIYSACEIAREEFPDKDVTVGEQ